MSVVAELGNYSLHKASPYLSRRHSFKQQGSLIPTTLCTTESIKGTLRMAWRSLEPRLGGMTFEEGTPDASGGVHLPVERSKGTFGYHIAPDRAPTA